MRRSFLILLLAALAGVAVLGISYRLAKWVCARQMTNTQDELAWLKSEFRLSDAEVERIRQLHSGYLPKCQQMCDQIAAKKKELQAALAAGVTPEAEKRLTEVALLRAQCQTQMLRHFEDVSKVMPPEQGRRYLSEMQQLTLGFHEQIERRMSGEGSSTHGNH